MIKFTLKEFPTHIAKTNNKVAPNKMIKINNQSIYNGYINRFTRNIVIKNMQDYVKGALFPQLVGKPLTAKILVYPINITVNIYTVKNHGSISMRAHKVCWKPAKASYSPNWDIENLATIWIKVINDVLTKMKIIPDDNIQYLNKVSYKYYEVKDINKRKIIITIR